MTVKQFISILEELPQNAEVVIPSEDMLGHTAAFSPGPWYYENYNRVYLSK